MAKLFYPFGYNGKKYAGQKTEKVQCPKCKHIMEVKVIESQDPEWHGFCHALITECPKCKLQYWVRDGFERS